MGRQNGSDISSSKSRQKRGQAILDNFKKQNVVIKMISKTIDKYSVDSTWNFWIDQVNDPVYKRVVPRHPNSTGMAYSGQMYDRTLRYNYNKPLNGGMFSGAIGWEKRELRKYDGVDAGLEYVGQKWVPRKLYASDIGKPIQGLPKKFMKDKNGKLVPNIYTKKTSVTLPPPNGQMRYFNNMPFGFLYDIDKVDLCRDKQGRPRYVFNTNAYTYERFWVGSSDARGNATNNAHMFTTIDAIRKTNTANIGKNRASKYHNEILAKISKESIKAIFCVEDPSASATYTTQNRSQEQRRQNRLRALWLSHYASDRMKLKLELPVVIVGDQYSKTNTSDVRIYADDEILADLRDELKNSVTQGSSYFYGSYGTSMKNILDDLYVKWLPTLEAAKKHGMQAREFDGMNAKLHKNEAMRQTMSPGGASFVRSVPQHVSVAPSKTNLSLSASMSQSPQQSPIASYAKSPAAAAQYQSHNGSDVSQGTLDLIMQKTGDDASKALARPQPTFATSALGSFGQNNLKSGISISKDEYLQFIDARMSLTKHIDGEIARLREKAYIVSHRVYTYKNGKQTSNPVIKQKNGIPIINSKSAYDKLYALERLKGRIEGIKCDVNEDLYDPTVKVLNHPHNVIDPDFKNKLKMSIKTCAEVLHHRRNWWHVFFTFGLHQSKSWRNWKSFKIQKNQLAINHSNGVNEYERTLQDSLYGSRRHFMQNGIQVNSYHTAKQVINFL